MNFLAKLLGRRREAAKVQGVEAPEASKTAPVAASPLPPPPPQAKPTLQAEALAPDGAAAATAPEPAEPQPPPPPAAPPETEEERLLRETRAYLSGTSDQPPAIAGDGPLHETFVENLALLRTLVDWTSGHVIDAEARRVITSPPKQDALAAIASTTDWTKLMELTHGMLLRIAPRQQAAVVVSLREQGPYLIEWIAHYRAIGFTGIFVYVHDAEDGSLALLRALAREGVIHLIETLSAAADHADRKALTHSLFLLPELRDFEWVFYAEPDDYLVPAERFDHRIGAVLSGLTEASPRVAGICYPTRWFVSDYEFDCRPEPLAERFTHSLPSDSVKALLRLADVLVPHGDPLPQLRPGSQLVNAALVPITETTSLGSGQAGGQVNHHWCKSFQEFRVGLLRGQMAGPLRGADFANPHDLFFKWNGHAAEATPETLPGALSERTAAERSALLARADLASLHDAVTAALRERFAADGGVIAAMVIYGECAQRLGIAPREGQLSWPDHTGPGFMDVMADLHGALDPLAYLEIGPPIGGPLRLARCDSLVVDPACEIDDSIMGDKRVCHLYRCESVEFFDRYDPAAILGRPIDLAFLDGLHLFEVLLKDFINTERHCRANSVIVMHDCLPPDVHMARRDLADMTHESASTHEGWWTGDIWKVPLILRRHRPDLHIVCIDSPPTGLVLISNLDPGSRVLSERLDALTEEYIPLSLATYGIARLHRDLDVRRTATIWDYEREPLGLAHGFRPGDDVAAAPEMIAEAPAEPASPVTPDQGDEHHAQSSDATVDAL